MPEALGQLIYQCWHPFADQRPTWEVICTLLTVSHSVYYFHIQQVDFEKYSPYSGPSFYSANVCPKPHKHDPLSIAQKGQVKVFNLRALPLPW